MSQFGAELTAEDVLEGRTFDDPNFMTRACDKWMAYGPAKTANVLFTVELERRFGPRGAHTYAMHPGVIMTQLGRHLTAQDIADMRTSMAARGDANVKIKSTAQGAAATLLAASAPELEGQGGVYLEDCHVAAVNDDASVPGGVRSHALNADDAKLLWELSERLVGQSFPATP
jgi:NAD(P)-dependent dehydrogenase (short-subunit alcohol dehydrogenase family)